MIDIDSFSDDQTWHRSIRHCIINTTYIHLLPAQQRPSGRKICANPAATSAWLSVPWPPAKEELDAPFLRKCSKSMMLYIYRQKQPLEPNKTGTRMNTHLTTGNIAKLGPHPMRFGRELLQLCLWSELKCQVMSDCNTWCICCSDIYFHCVYMLLQVARVLGLSAVSLMLQWWWHDSCTMGPTWSLRDVLRCDKASPVKVSEGYRGTKQQPKSHSCWHHAF